MRGEDADGDKVMRYEGNKDMFWLHQWCWDILDMEFRAELNPLNWTIGIMLGPSGMRLDFPCIAFGLTWGSSTIKHREENERRMLKYLKQKYPD